MLGHVGGSKLSQAGSKSNPRSHNSARGSAMGIRESDSGGGVKSKGTGNGGGKGKGKDRAEGLVGDEEEAYAYAAMGDEDD